MNRKNILASFWKDKCTIYVQTASKNQTTKRTEFTETALVTDEPCKLSYDNTGPATQIVSIEENVPALDQTVKLFMSNETVVPAGSKVAVTRDGRTFYFRSSGEPKVFIYHQEIGLEIDERWA